ncbi:unnamed protein product [Rhizophagus irregularis]|nr:unnamed protein product [Rhizophagus irregularis]
MGYLNRSTKSCDQEYKQRPRYMNRRQQLKVFGYKSNHYKGNKSGIFAEVAEKGQRNLRKGFNRGHSFQQFQSRDQETNEKKTSNREQLRKWNVPLFKK